MGRVIPTPVDAAEIGHDAGASGSGPGLAPPRPACLSRFVRRLPVFLLLDSSGSMQGEPIESVRSGLQALTSSLRQDPYALETVHLSVLTFDADVKVLCPLTPLEQFQVPQIVLPKSGPTHLGLALERLLDEVDRTVSQTTEAQRGDWRPMLFVMTDGAVSDLMAYEEILPAVKAKGFASIIACAAGPKAKKEQLQMLTDRVVILESMDPAGFAALFQWVSASISANSAGTPGAAADLPPPPPELGGSPVL